MIKQLIVFCGCILLASSSRHPTFKYVEMHPTFDRGSSSDNLDLDLSESAQFGYGGFGGRNSFGSFKNIGNLGSLGKGLGGSFYRGGLGSLGRGIGGGYRGFGNIGSLGGLGFGGGLGLGGLGGRHGLGRLL